MTRQKLGQHFLTDHSVVMRMLDSTPAAPGDIIVEIGPGKGVLTAALAERGHRVIAIEWDEALAESLRVQYPEVNVVQADIRTFDLISYLEKHAGTVQYAIVANLPYYLSSYLLRQVFQYRTLPNSMTLMVQKEVAERIVAGPGASERSMLSVMVQAYSEPNLAFAVPARSFSPPPRVESAVVVFDQISKQSFEDMDERAFFRMVKAGFGERRKLLLNSLSGGLQRDKAVIEKALIACGIAVTARAQELNLAEWKRLYHQLEA